MWCKILLGQRYKYTIGKSKFYPKHTRTMSKLVHFGEKEESLPLWKLYLSVTTKEDELELNNNSAPPLICGFTYDFSSLWSTIVQKY